MLRSLIFLSVIVLTIAVCTSCTHERFLTIVDNRVTTLTEETDNWCPHNTESTALARLGAGDGIGGEIYDQYVAFVNAGGAGLHIRQAGIILESTEQDFLTFLEYGNPFEADPQTMMSNVDPDSPNR